MRIGTRRRPLKNDSALRQLDAAEAVIHFGGDDPHQNTDELVFNFAERGRHLIEGDLLNHRHGGR